MIRDDILSLLYWFTDALIVVHDKNGKTITVGMSVMMPEPNETDIYTIGDWIGNVEDIFDNGNLIIEEMDSDIEDMGSDFFEIEPNRVEVNES
jgi:hypothetical protein